MRRTETEYRSVAAQAARYETLFTQEARLFLSSPERLGTGVPMPSAESVLRVAEHADRWALAKYGDDFNRERITFVMHAQRMIEHPTLFSPVGASRIDHDRVWLVADSIAAHARAIGQHLKDRAEAQADVEALLARLAQALALAHGAAADFNADYLPAEGPRREQVLNEALAQYQAARRMASQGPASA